MAAGDLAPPADDLLPAQPLELALATEPPSPGPGEPAKLQVTVRDLNGNPVPWDELLVVHGQKIHVIIVPDDFEALTHAHAFPAVGGAVGTFELSTVFPRAGRYAISVECAVRGAAPGGEPEMLRVFRPFVLGVGGAGDGAPSAEGLEDKAVRSRIQHAEDLQADFQDRGAEYDFRAEFGPSRR